MNAKRKEPVMTYATMLIRTTSGLREAGCQDEIFSEAPRAIAEFFKGNRLCAGFSTQYAVNPRTREVVEIFKKGKLAQRDIKPLLAEGFTVWSFSWAWAPDTFRIEGETVKVSRTIDVTPRATSKAAAAYGRALGIL
jgi:hypothetical protein